MQKKNNNRIILFALNLKDLRVFRFIISGGIAAFINISSRYLLSNFINYKLSILLSYMIGVSVAFILMRKFVFSFKKDILYAQIYRFIIVNILGLLQTLLVSLTLKSLLLIFLKNLIFIELFSHFAGVCFPVITSYYAHKLFTFK